MGQKKHHHSSVPTTTLVTTWSHAANSRARPEKTHAPLKVVLPKLIPARCVPLYGNQETAFDFRNVLRATTAPATKNDICADPLPKVVRRLPSCFVHFDFDNTPQRRSHFFNSEPPKVAPNMSPRPSVFNTFYFQMCFAPQRRALFRHLNFQKCSETAQFLTLFTSKCASRHNAVHFFVISTSKTAPNPSVFNTFYFQICFAPQRRALFQHLNFQKWSDAEVFCTFSLRNRLRATTACNFSSLISPDVSAPAALASLLFNPPEPQNHEKTQCFATFLPFRAPASSFFWSFLFWLFSLLTAFSSLHIVGSLTSKLLSINQVKLLGIQWESNICHVT